MPAKHSICSIVYCTMQVLIIAILCGNGITSRGLRKSETVNDSPLQNYQEFNDLRSLYYKKSNFINGYPSATGIGTANGGCMIEVIALKEKQTKNVKPVNNSLQVDAHSYSSDVLGGDSAKEMSELSTPKFERGKVYENWG